MERSIHGIEIINQVTNAQTKQDITFQAIFTTNLDVELLKFTINEIEAGNPEFLNSKLLTDFKLMFSDSIPENKENEIDLECQNKKQKFVIATDESNPNYLLKNTNSFAQDFYIQSNGNKISDLHYIETGNKRCMDGICKNNKRVSPFNKNLFKTEELLLKSESGNRDNFLENTKASKESHKQSISQTFYVAQTRNSYKNISRHLILNNVHDANIGFETRNLRCEIPTFNTYPGSITSRIHMNKSAPTYQKSIAKVKRFDQLHSINKGQHKNNKATETKSLTIEESADFKINDSINFLNETAISSKETKMPSISETNSNLVASQQKEPSICCSCNKDFEEHVIMCETKKFYECCICIYNMNKGHLLTHLKIHGVEPFYCTECKEEFHGKGSHRSDVTCNVCKENFRCKTLLLEHSVEHKQFCMLCGKRISNHIFKQNKKRILKCCSCKYATSGITNLCRHFLSHFREKAYKCKECGQRYYHDCSLRKHTSSHVLK